MKKTLILCLLAGLVIVPTPGSSQVEALLVDAALSLLGLKSGDKYGKARLIELKKILDKNKKELAKLARIEESGQATELYTQAQLEIARSIEELMRSTGELRAIRSADGTIRFNDLVVFNQIQQEVNQYLSGHVPAQFLRQLERQIADGAARNYPLAADNGGQIYDMFFGRSGLDVRQPANLTDLGAARGEEAQHLLQFQTAAQKKKIVQSLLYYKLSDELYAQSVTLNNALNDERNGVALDLARRMQRNVLQRMSGTSIDQLLSDPTNLGMGLDLLSMGSPANLLNQLSEELKGQFQQMVNEINSEAQSFLSGLEGPFATVNLGASPTPDMGYFADANAPRGLHLTTGERASLQKAAMDMASQSVEYRQKGDKLMEEALEKTPLQQVLEMKRARSYMQESYRYLDLSL
ncbi:hypothetical protein [Rudanella lutea]|uniref:hypothetical protein n=1 Tax=Rudanella lutea TaxID=451374 RepID=UPI00036B7A6A|nr:hypothetical protein [Rudanella lutea]